jgi:hypothetical protein
MNGHLKLAPNSNQGMEGRRKIDLILAADKGGKGGLNRKHKPGFSVLTNQTLSALISGKKDLNLGLKP